jgi:PadR family transcriptional regulator, regulatory protein PadR
MLLMESSIRDIELTPTLAALIEIFLLDAERPRYGSELMRLTGQHSGSFYRNLAALEQAGWVTGGTEHLDPSAERRPPRRFYRITRPAVFEVYPKLALLNENVRGEHVRRLSLIVEWPHSESRPDASHVSND